MVLGAFYARSIERSKKSEEKWFPTKEKRKTTIEKLRIEISTYLL